MLDVDHFKAVNDQYGHQVGDMALRHVASYLVNSIRPYDSVGRFGGEEFLMIVPNADKVSAQMVAERIRINIANSPLVLIDGTQIALHVSAGISQAPQNPHPCTLEDIIKCADEALHQAKRDGRNCVRVHAD